MSDREMPRVIEAYPEGTPLMEGLPVVSADGESLGTVAEEAGDRFRVAAPLAPDYWLPKEAIAGLAAGGDLGLSLPEDAIDGHKLDPPEGAE